MTTLTSAPQNGRLSLDGVPLRALAEKYGTPLYVYSHQTLVDNFRRIHDAFAPVDALVAFSMKCNSNRAILRSLLREGSGLDIVSGGELLRGLEAGADPTKIIFAGVGKRREEIALALKHDILAFNVESEPEAEAIAEVAAGLGKQARICIRVNPDVDAATHDYITTGKKENKFGIAFHGVRDLFKRLSRLEGLRLTGLHAHIGSQILKPEGYIKTLGRMQELLEAIRNDGHPLEILNLGGGFGIAYEEHEQPMDVAALAEQMIPALRELNAKIIFEPGRSVAGPAGYMLTRVIYIKHGEAKHFAIVDGAMNDLIRPSLYSAYHRILLDEAGDGSAEQYDIVGPICESGDFLGKDRSFRPLGPGDLLAVCDAGAYGFVMASNYNSRPKPPEVMVRDGKDYLIRRRESLDELTANEQVPDFLIEDAATT